MVGGHDRPVRCSGREEMNGLFWMELALVNFVACYRLGPFG